MYEGAGEDCFISIALNSRVGRRMDVRRNMYMDDIDVMTWTAVEDLLIPELHTQFAKL